MRTLIFGLGAASMASVLRILAQFLILPILSRLLTPADYGLVAIAMPFVAFAMAISDGGLCSSLVRDNRRDDKAWSSAFWLITIGALIMSIVLCAIAPLLADVLSESLLTKVMAALCLTLLLQAATTVPLALLQRDQKFLASGLAEIGAVFAGVAAALLVAVHGGGVWALVAQQLVFWVIRSIFTWLAARPSIHFVLDISLIRSDLRFGWDVVRNSALLFFSRYLDGVIVGLVLGVAAAGHYSIAFQFMRLPATILLGPGASILYSVLARKKADFAFIKTIFLALSRLLCALLFPAMMVAAAAHGPIFRILFSEKWDESGIIFLFMGPAGAVHAATFLTTPFLLALGRPDVQLRLTLEFAVLWLVLVIGASQISVFAVAAAMNLAVIFYIVRLVRIGLPVLGCTSREYIGSALVSMICALLAVGAYCVAAMVISQIAIQFAIAIVIAAIGSCAALFSQRRELLELRRLLQS